MQRDKNILRFIEDYKSITIFQAYRIFFNKCKFGYDVSRKRLKILCDMGILKQGKNPLTNEIIYYFDKQISPHDLLLLDFYSLLIFNGAKILEFKKFPRYYEGSKYIEPDAFFRYSFNNVIQGVFVEIDFTHATDLSKYEPYFSGYFSKLYGGNPYVCIVSDNPKKQNMNFCDVVYLDLKLNNFVSQILG